MNEPLEEILVSFAYVSAFAIAGTLSRVGCDWILANTLTTLLPYAGPIGTDFLANLVGCFVMGLAIAVPQLNKGRTKLLYLGVTSGFCGSLTTFSGWQVQASLAFLHPKIVDGLLALLIGVCSFKCLLEIGAYMKHLFHAITSHKRKKKQQEVQNQNQPRNDPVSWRWQWESVVAIALAASLWVLFGLLFIFEASSRAWSGPAFFAPWGAGIRWYASRWNVFWPKFRVATFAVNVIGSIIYAILYLLKCQEKNAFSVSILSSLISGVCGTLTTVSTFIKELRDIKPPRYAHYYGWTSVLVTQAAVLITLGVGKRVGDIDLFPK